MNIIVALDCPKCGAELDVEPHTTRMACGYCGCKIAVERKGGGIALRDMVAVLSRVEVNTSRSAFELTLQRLDRDMSSAETELQSILYEIDNDRLAQMNACLKRFRAEENILRERKDNLSLDLEHDAYRSILMIGVAFLCASNFAGVWFNVATAMFLVAFVLWAIKYYRTSRYRDAEQLSEAAWDRRIHLEATIESFYKIRVAGLHVTKVKGIITETCVEILENGGADVKVSDDLINKLYRQVERINSISDEIATVRATVYG